MSTSTPAPGLITARTAVTRDLELAVDGWRRRFVGAPPRLDEVVELYRELGHDVRIEQLGEDDLSPACTGCRLALAAFRIVYTRLSP